MSLIKSHHVRVLSCSLLLLPLTGCILGQRHAIPEDGLTLPQLYRQATQPSAPLTVQTALHQQNQNAKPLTVPSNQIAPIPQPNYVGYTRTASNEINTLFRPQPNPSIPIYIYPHLTQLGDDTIPVPGYTSSFFLHKQNRYVHGMGY